MVKELEQDDEFNKENIEKVYRKSFKIPDNINCEIIDRTRANKISFHVRFDVNISDVTINTLLCHLDDNVVLQYLDRQIYKT